VRTSWWLAAALWWVPSGAGADSTVASQRVSDQAAQSVAVMLDGLRDALVELDQLRRVPHSPGRACLEPVEGMRAGVRDAQQAHLELETALATANSPAVSFALARVERGRQRTQELRERLHACVDRALREAPIEPWSQQQVVVVAPPISDAVWSPSWPPEPPVSGPRIIRRQ
jgi:hypothetical protein